MNLPCGPSAELSRWLKYWRGGEAAQKRQADIFNTLTIDLKVVIADACGAAYIHPLQAGLVQQLNIVPVAHYCAVLFNVKVVLRLSDHPRAGKVDEQLLKILPLELIVHG